MAALPGSPKRLVDRLALGGEKLWPLLGDVETVLQPNAKLAVDHDGWLVAETHAYLNWRLVSAHEVRPFVTIEADAVTGAMR